MNTHSAAFYVPHHPPVAPAFRPLLRLIPNCIETFGCRQTAALCRQVSGVVFQQIASGVLDTAEGQQRLASLDITVSDLDRFGFWLLNRANEMDVGGQH